MAFEIELIQQEALPTLSVRKRTGVQDLPAVLGQTYGEIMTYAAEMGATVSGPAYVSYFNMDMADLDVEIGFVCEQTVLGNGTVTEGEIAAGRYVTSIHYGPYAGMEPLYNAMFTFIQENGLAPTGESIEFYYNSPAEVPESELKTKILMRVM